MRREHNVTYTCLVGPVLEWRADQPLDHLGEVGIFIGGGSMQRGRRLL